MPTFATKIKLFLLSACLLLSACSPHPLADWKTNKLIIILPAEYSTIDALYERDLAELLAQQLRVPTELRFTPSDKIITALLRGEGHIAAAALPINDSYTALRFTPPHLATAELVICNDTFTSIDNIEQLNDLHLLTLAESSQELLMRDLRKTYPQLRWHVSHHTDFLTLLGNVANSDHECAISNELQLAEARNHYPNLKVVYEFSPRTHLAWALPSNSDPILVEQLTNFFQRITQDDTLKRLYDRHFGYSQRLNNNDANTFISRVSTILPEYRTLFEEAARQTNLDWRLLAALAYQESQWDPEATSFAKVRGMMMLTEDTAERMQVHNRLDPSESILAGARYLALLKSGLSHISEPDRTWMAVAAYNQGYMHLEDARILAEQQKLNPNSWTDIKKTFPLLSKPEFADKAKYGSTRGGEAVIMTENIRSFYNILRRLKPEPTDNPSYVNKRRE